MLVNYGMGVPSKNIKKIEQIQHEVARIITGLPNVSSLSKKENMRYDTIVT
jgi:hypothetical protein